MNVAHCMIAANIAVILTAGIGMTLTSANIISPSGKSILCIVIAAWIVTFGLCVKFGLTRRVGK